MLRSAAVTGLHFVLSLALAQELPPGGTRPNELSQALLPEPSSSCNCHYDYDATHRNEPGQSYMATAMALSMRSPVFKAALRISFQDRPDVSGICIRCHSPRGWLGGRSTPGDGSALEEEDKQGITCDTCHRMIPADPPVISSGQYTISPSTAKRGPRTYLPTSHSIAQSAYVSSAEACAVCHSLFNPTVNHHDPDGRDLGYNYFEQRTYEEWRDSDVSSVDDKTCIDCHMRRASGYSNSFDRTNLYPDLAVHSIVGGSLFIAQAVNMLEPNLRLGPELANLEAVTKQQLEMAATLSLTTTHAANEEIDGGSSLAVGVRVTNDTGHKLPTGYPEGRRVYLEVSLELEDRPPVIISGRFNPETGDLDPDDQLRTYDTGHGVLGQGRSPHLILANQTLWDTRIPPKGFRPDEPDMRPYGRDYGSAPYRNYDEHTFQVPVPRDVTQRTNGRVVVRLLYQSLYGFYYDFLIANLPPDSSEAQDLTRVYNAFGKAPPREMERIEIPIVALPGPPAPPDAGVGADLGGANSGADAGGVPPGIEGGCECSETRVSRSTTAWLGILLASWLVVRRRPR